MRRGQAHPLRWVVTVTGLLCSCADSLSVEFPFHHVTINSKTAWTRPCAELPSPLLTQLPIESLFFVHVEPPGSPIPSTGSVSNGLLISLESPPPLPGWIVVAPADGFVQPFGEVALRSTLTLQVCQEVSVQLEGLLPFQSLKTITAANGGHGGFVPAGTPLGIVHDGQHFVLTVNDLRVHRGVLPAARSVFQEHAACPLTQCGQQEAGCFQYMADAQIDQWLRLLRNRRGEALASSQACGEYPSEQEGTALGVWFPQDPAPPETAEVTPLFLLKEPSGEPSGIISNGGRQVGANQWVFSNVSEGISWVPFAEAPVGPHNDDFSHVVPGVDGGPGVVHCYDGLTDARDGPANTVVLLAMESEGELVAEAAQVADCRSFASDGGYALPMQAQVRLVR